MEPDSSHNLLDIAGAIADGEAIDWRKLEEAPSEPAADLRGLRVVAAISAANRRVLEHSGEATATMELGATVPMPAVVEFSGSHVATTGVLGSEATWGPLTLIEKIGEGSFGEVFRAHDPRLGADVALKLQRSDAGLGSREQERFLAEARKLARVRHPNVLVVHGAARHAGRLGLWTDMVEGETLDDLIRTRGALGPREAAMIGIELCHALAAVHRVGLVHRDVKAANVMRERGGRILLMDFGTVGESVAGVVAGGGLYGTPLMMAPEQILGAPVGPPADIYAIGALLYYLVTRELPIEAESMEQLVARHANGEHVLLRDRRPDLPAEFVQVVERCLERDPANRYASTGALEHALAASAGVPVSNDPKPPRPGRTLAGALAAAAVVVVAILIATHVPKPADGTHGTTAPATTALAPAGPLAATATLYRAQGNGETPLLAGAHVAPGTRLSLRYECAESSFVYVLDEDERGHAYVLFPIPGGALANPLPAGRELMLPGELGGETARWEVTSSGGTESIMVVAARHPLADLEHDLASVPRARPGAAIPYPALGQRAALALRGIGGIATSPATAATGGRITDALGRIASNGSTPHDVWIWQTSLANPEPR